ncbi:unnamed protein product [Mytilus coruscus]|uniref:Integrase zinc-binding domain-containing protein n=1 Tax=Mytilus coruscus TaxID=42192 RepID=A0A6J8BWP6_MYTCO|nr:unnamed protein product [Mytilus coruscus]
MRGNEESLPELPQSIKKLNRQFYQSVPSSITSVLALEHFIDALLDADLKLKLRESNIKSIHESETLVVRLETLKLAERHTGAWLDRQIQFILIRPRRIPLARIKDDEAEIQKIVKQDIIEPSTSPWNSNIVLVKKSDNSWRFCIDFRSVNFLVLRPSYPLPRIDDTIDSFLNNGQTEKDNPFEGIDFENVSESQLSDMSDDVISIIIQWKIDEVKPTWADVSHISLEVKFYWSRLNSLILANGILYRKWESYNGKHYDLHLVLPANFKRSRLNEVHNTVTGGHLGVRKTLSKIRQRYFWYTMRHC